MYPWLSPATDTHDKFKYHLKLNHHIMERTKVLSNNNYKLQKLLDADIQKRKNVRAGLSSGVKFPTCFFR